MPMANVYKNFTNVYLRKTDGNTVSVQSVADLNVGDNTQFDKAGADNDQSFTFKEPKAEESRLRVQFLDINEALKLARLKGDLYWTEVAVRGTSKDMVCYNVAFTMVPSQGKWSDIRTYDMNAEGGSVWPAGAAS